MSRPRKGSPLARKPTQKDQERLQMACMFVNQQDEQSKKFDVFVDEVETRAMGHNQSRTEHVSTSVELIANRFETALDDRRRLWSQVRAEMISTSAEKKKSRDVRADRQRQMQDKLHDSGMTLCDKSVTECETSRDAETTAAIVSFKAEIYRAVSRKRGGGGLDFPATSLPSATFRTQFTVRHKNLIFFPALVDVRPQQENTLRENYDLSEQPLQAIDDQSSPCVPEAQEPSSPDAFDTSTYDRLASGMNVAFQQSQTFRRTTYNVVQNKLDYDVRQLALHYRIKQVDIRSRFHAFLGSEMDIHSGCKPTAVEEAVEAFHLTEVSRAKLFAQAIYMIIDRWKQAASRFTEELRSSESRLVDAGLIQIQLIASHEGMTIRESDETIWETPVEFALGLHFLPYLFDDPVEFAPSVLPSLLKRMFKRNPLPVIVPQHDNQEWGLFRAAQQQREEEFSAMLSSQRRDASHRERRRDDVFLQLKRSHEDDARVREEDRTALFQVALTNVKAAWEAREAAREKEFRAVLRDIDAVFTPAHQMRIKTLLDAFGQVHTDFMKAARDAASGVDILMGRIRDHGYVTINV